MDYGQEQLLNQGIVQEYLSSRGEEEKSLLREQCREYFRFREEVAGFHLRYFQAVCTVACFQQQRSACCSKDGIITFFADIVVNAIVSSASQMAGIMACLRQPRQDMKCLYLGPQGCRWQMKPMVCEMFVCDRAKDEVFGDSTVARAAWDGLKERALSFRWPDRAVLFDEIESRFMAAGVRSSLMFLHNSPGLIRIKKLAGRL